MADEIIKTENDAQGNQVNLVSRVGLVWVEKPSTGYSMPYQDINSAAVEQDFKAQLAATSEVPAEPEVPTEPEATTTQP